MPKENVMEQKIAVLGAGSWGTALAICLSENGHSVKMWDINPEHLQELKEKRENVRYLPGIAFGEKLALADSPEEAVRGADMVLFSVPAQHFRSALEGVIPYLTDSMVLVNVAKGIEQKSLMRISEIVKEKMPEAKFAVLSGPSHAAEYVQDVFMCDWSRVYTNTDVVGVELGGALKNIIALGAGISDGMGYGDNTKAAMMTRGIAEMTRLGTAMGADISTFAGLSGIGDLIVTCCSMHSRNRRCGILIGQGVKPSEATKQVGMVVEGMFTTEAAYQLASRLGVEMPITESIYNTINDKIDAREAVRALMTRQKKHETKAQEQ